MMHISVSFTFDAESMEEAQETVASWVVTPGVTLLGMQGTEQGMSHPVTMPMGGTIGGALLETAQRSPAPTPPLPPPTFPPPPIATAKGK